MRNSSCFPVLISRTFLALAACSVWGIAAHADNQAASPTYPNKAVRIIVPFGPAGVADALPRIVGQKLSEKWGVPVVIDNKPGASGNIGMTAGIHAPADGYTLTLAPAGNLTVNPTLFSNLSFDVKRDIAPITVLGESPNLLVVNAKVPVKDFGEFISRARQSGVNMSFGSPGTGTGPHLAGEVLNQIAGTHLLHVPYNAMALAMNDVMGGTLDSMFVASAISLPHIQSGKLRVLAVAGPSRLSQLPDVPTVAESGFPGLDVTSWYGIVVPQAVPKPIINKLHQDISEVLKMTDVRQKFAALGVTPVGSSPQEFSAMILTESKKWGDIMRAANIKPTQ
jgi:tripartite-type tricarboxylate transporter receptor subunit TctC